ncbi:MAG: response regulator [Acidobacteriota bacterium]
MALVLIADDSMFQRFLLGKIVTSLGHQVLDAADGRQLLDLALEQRPDLIIMDINMPELSGIQALETFQAQGLDFRTVVVTADIQNTTRTRCLELGAAQVLNKPLEEDRLRELLAGLLSS